MFETMRYVAIRPPQRDLPAFTLRLAFESSPFIVALLDARSGDQPRENMLDVVHAFTAGEEDVGDPATLGLRDPLTTFADAARAESLPDHARLEELLEAAVGQGAVPVRDSQDFQVTRRRLSDSIIAVMIDPAGEPTLLGDLSHLLRVIDLVERLAREEEDLLIPGAVDAVLSQPLVVPPSLFPLPPPTPPVLVAPGAPGHEDDELAVLVARQAQLRSAIRQLSDRLPADFQRPPERPEPEPEPPRVRPPGPAPVPAGGPASETVGSGSLVAAGRRRPGTVAAVRASRPDESHVTLLLRPDVMGRLDDGTRALFEELGAVPTTTPVPLVLARLESELRLTSDAIALLEPVSRGTRVVRVGTSLVRARSGPTAATASTEVALPESGGVPESVGSVRPAGIGRLLLVKQQPKAYVPGAVAHIDNYLRGESKERSTRRLTRREETFTLETETTRELEQDLQTTTQHALQGETVKTIEQDQSFSVGVSVSAGYGPFFQVDANTQFATATSTTESAKRAFSIAKQVIDRSAARLTERIRREQTTRTLEEFEETNRHAVDNSAGDDHVVGVYQWVDQVLEAQVYDYGARLFFDFLVPEPAAFLHRAVEADESQAEELVEPAAFTTPPQEIDQSNYRNLVHQYGVTGVEPPPPLFVTVARSFSDKAETPGADFTQQQTIDLPPGYYAYNGYVVAAFVRWSEIDGEDVDPTHPIVRINLGRHDWVRHDGDALTHTFFLDHEQGELPVSLSTLHAASYAVNVEVLCQRDHLRYETWQLQTHEAVMTAYLKLKADYDEKLAEAATRQAADIQGRNPMENRLIERAELKKHSISLLTAQHFDAFSAVLESGGSMPRIDFDEADAEGRYIRFFELAFEWENMTYVLYPYFWGRKHGWLDRVLLRDVDAVHAEFGKAGAGRVVAPVRPGFERALMHFLDTGQVWHGGDLPQIGNPLYVDILEEIRERLDAPGEEVPVFEPWEVRLPTTLVRLAPGAALPAWVRDEDGQLVPVEHDEDEDG